MSQEHGSTEVTGRDPRPQERKYPDLTPEELRNLARQIVQLIKKDLAAERDRFGR